LSLIGFPVLPPSGGVSTAPHLLDWSGLLKCAAVARCLGADDVRLAHGVAMWTLDTGPALCRVYVLLARAASRAWNVNLSMRTACPPNTPEPVVRTNDHLRAAAVFGRLHLGWGSADEQNGLE